MSAAKEVRSAFTPNQGVAAPTRVALVLVQFALAMVAWSRLPEVLPTLADVARSLQTLWFEQGLGHALVTSLTTSLFALALSTVLSLLLAWGSVVPVLAPLAQVVTRGRFLGLTGLSFVFLLTLGGGQALRVALLVFGTTVFLTTTMVAEVAAIPRAKFEHARTLRFSAWRVWWEVVVRGTSDRALEAVRQNAAIGWTLLTTVEGLTRAEGGVGTLLMDQNKHLHLAEVFAIQFVVLVVGLTQDVALGALARALCPWAQVSKGAAS